MPLKELKYDSPMLDGRRKLEEWQREEIRKTYKAGDFSLRQLGREYGVSHRLIIFIVHPERYEDQKQYRKQIKAHKKYYEKNQHRESVRKYRAKKRELGYLGSKSLK